MLYRLEMQVRTGIWKELDRSQGFPGLYSTGLSLRGVRPPQQDDPFCNVAFVLRAVVL
jgi:hypothetical protein